MQGLDNVLSKVKLCSVCDTDTTSSQISLTTGLGLSCGKTKGNISLEVIILFILVYGNMWKVGQYSHSSFIYSEIHSNIDTTYYIHYY